MPFHFKPTESLARAMRRMCLGRIRKACKRLRQGARPASVHGARKDIKKLRAALKLVRGELGRTDYRKTVKALRRAANDLAGSRDAWVAFQVFEKLTGGDLTLATVRKLLWNNFRHEARRFLKNDAVRMARWRLQKADRRVGGLNLQPGSWAALDPGLRESYRGGKEAFDLVRREPLPEALHCWRKHVKTLWYQLCLLCPTWPPALQILTERLALLGEVLGDDRDLILLQQLAAELCAKAHAEVAVLNQLIATRQDKLRITQLKLGALVYREAPAAFSRRVGRYWSGWHDPDCRGRRVAMRRLT